MRIPFLPIPAVLLITAGRGNEQPPVDTGNDRPQLETCAPEQEDTGQHTDTEGKVSTTPVTPEPEGPVATNDSDTPESAKSDNQLPVMPLTAAQIKLFVEQQKVHREKMENDKDFRSTRIRWRATQMERVAQIMEAEDAGKDIRTDLEKTLDRALTRRYADPHRMHFMALMVTLKLKRLVSLAEQDAANQHSRNRAEDITRTLESESREDNEYSAASEHLVAAAQGRATRPSHGQSELDKAIYAFHAQLQLDPDCSNAYKRLETLQPEGISWWRYPIAPLNSAPCFLATIRLEEYTAKK